MVWVHKCVFYCRTYSADHYLQEAKKLKHNADALVSKSAMCIQCLHIMLGFVYCFCYVAACLYYRTFWYFLSIFSSFFFFFSIFSVWQVWEGCVLPRCSSVVHWVWECIGEKCSGIQVPVPYVFRNCGINQVSTVEHVDVLPLTFEVPCSPLRTDHLPLRSSYWSLKCVLEGWDPLFQSSWCLNNL